MAMLKLHSGVKRDVAKSCKIWFRPKPRYPYCFRPKPRSIFLTTSLSFESAFCNIADVQQGNASFENMFNPRWGFVVLLGSHI